MAHEIIAKSAQSILQKILTDQCDTLCVRINNVIDLPDPIPEDDDDSYNCMNVDFDRYVVAGIFSQDALGTIRVQLYSCTTVLYASMCQHCAGS
eukprot:COSAG01_NODE_5067_length_4516_cov_456.515961_3_plen_94_part_00